ncbi:MAG: hypothetical protein FWF87_00420 [Synergistaceae bacterium]|nr:hypothetical protein [Synergistaceae bacterium]
MSEANYKWLIVGEGNNDLNRFTKLLIQFEVKDVHMNYVGGKGNVFRMNQWNKLPNTAKNRIVSQLTLRNDQVRPGFMGVILVVDSDVKETLSQNYAEYSQECRSTLASYADWQQPQNIAPSIMRLDTIKGTSGRKLPIYGLSAPASGQGCLETDLLRSYGYPANEKEWNEFSDVIKSASKSWVAEEKSSDGKEWWDLSRNGKAKMDKFMYAALKIGFEVHRLKIKLIKEPQIIQDIKRAMELGSYQT